MRSAQIETLRIQGCSRSVLAFVKQLVVSAFIWPAAGLSNISSKPSRSAIPLESLAFSTMHSQKGQAEPSLKIVRRGKERHDKPTGASPTGSNSHFASQVSFFRHDSGR
jgi:hypothetical protein